VFIKNKIMNIVTAHSSIPFWILIAITTGVMITGSLVKDLTAQALTTHERYHIGWEDGCADVNSHSDTHHNFYSHDGYYLHSSDHMKHYNHGLADCISQHPYNTIDMNHNTYNNNNNDNNPSAITTSNNQGQERYHIGWEDGCADVNSHSDTRERLNTQTNHEHHSSDYIRGYNHGLADCISQHPYNTIDMNHNTYNNNDNNPSAITTSNNQGQANATTPTNPATTSNNQGQANNQRVFCVVAVGTCNVTSGQAQNLDNK
jgi:hypothetical protein